MHHLKGNAINQSLKNLFYLIKLVHSEKIRYTLDDADIPVEIIHHSILTCNSIDQFDNRFGSLK